MLPIFPVTHQENVARKIHNINSKGQCRHYQNALQESQGSWVSCHPQANQVATQLSEANTMRNKWTTAGEVDRIDLRKCTHQYDEKQGNKNMALLFFTSFFFCCEQ